MIRQVPADTSLISSAFDTYDYLAFIFLLVAIVAIFSLIIWVLGLPGKIAIQRRHPHAETVKLMGWAGALAARFCVTLKTLLGDMRRLMW